ncbi:hypothetical protein CVT24_003436 [Panaeolus cyanescens]|uniref:Fatty acid desaturase domain-containing protein n=1 Tax=Panaeolus cyanescens TaxID=181874 RepID=A0A409Y701_9AGAR|nr:hypothetical protein CVT24_003436 [Panaeolus cyanescens]
MGAQPKYRNGKPVFKPTDVTLKDVSSRIPRRLHEPHTMLGLYYLGRDIVCVAAFWTMATKIPDITGFAVRAGYVSSGLGACALKWSLWGLYWYFQSLAMTALWVLGHEAGHRAFSSSRAVCDIVGWLTHSFTGTPYFSWKITHHIHHSFHGSFERDAHHVPKTRSQLGVPREEPGKKINYREILEDTPLYTIFMLAIHQFIGFPLYIATNLGGQPHFPPYSSHYNPNATALFKPNQKWAVLASDVGIGSVIAACVYYSTIYGWASVFKYYLIPWLGVNHWIMVIVFLQHTDPRIPHYRSEAWNYTRGAACTIDRPLLGWLGRKFFHDVAHFHVAHHLFPRMPFYHTEEATKIIKEVLGDAYLEHEEWWIPNLWNCFKTCVFVEDEGQILFYKDVDGNAMYEVDE